LPDEGPMQFAGAGKQWVPHLRVFCERWELLEPAPLDLDVACELEPTRRTTRPNPPLVARQNAARDADKKRTESRREPVSP
jgi:hypothetical protein